MAPAKLSLAKVTTMKKGHLLSHATGEARSRWAEIVFPMLRRWLGRRVRSAYLMLVAHDLYRERVAMKIISRAVNVAIKLDSRASQRTDELIRQCMAIGLPEDDIRKIVLKQLAHDLRLQHATSRLVRASVHRFERYWAQGKVRTGKLTSNHPGKPVD